MKKIYPIILLTLLIMSSDFNTFGAIDDGEYMVYYRNPGKSGILESNWAVNNTEPVNCIDGRNPSPLSPYSKSQKNGIYIHSSNKSGYAGKIYDKKSSENYVIDLHKERSIQYIEIDSTEFYEKRIQPELYGYSKYRKKRNKIKIKCRRKVFCFEDNLNGNTYQEFHIKGYYRQRVFIQQIDYNNETYYMISPEINKIDTLIGNPKIYLNKILCVEGDKTDGMKTIEVWDIKTNESILLYRNDLVKLGIYSIDDIFLLNDYIYIKTTSTGKEQIQNVFIRIQYSDSQIFSTKCLQE